MLTEDVVFCRKIAVRRANPLWSQYPLQILRITTKYRYITMTDTLSYSMVVYQQIIRKVCPFRIQLNNDTLFGPSSNTLFCKYVTNVHPFREALMNRAPLRVIHLRNLKFPKSTEQPQRSTKMFK